MQATTDRIRLTRRRGGYCETDAKLVTGGHSNRTTIHRCRMMSTESFLNRIIFQLHPLIISNEFWEPIVTVYQTDHVLTAVTKCHSRNERSPVVTRRSLAGSRGLQIMLNMAWIIKRAAGKMPQLHRTHLLEISGVIAVGVFYSLREFFP
jgi:hypothetical protein